MISTRYAEPIGRIGAGSRQRAPRQRRWFRPHLLVMGIVFLGAIAVGYVVMPGTSERIAALQRDGKNREALGILEREFARGDRSQRTLFQLQRLYEHFGLLEKARQTLEMLAELRPRDPTVQRELAQFYKLTQNEAGYVAALASQLAVRYSEPACKELIGIHRRNGDYAAEQATITSCRKKGYRRPDDVIRLAYLVAADGNLVEASTLLRSVDDRRRLKVDRDRVMFFTALLEAGDAVEAQKRALRWLKGSRDNSLALLLIDNLAKENRQDLAFDLARDVGTPGDSVSLAVAELMLDRDQVITAKSYLKGWLEAASLTEVDLVHRFIAAALDAEDPELAFRAGEAFGLDRVGQSELVMIAEALSAVGQNTLFQKLRDIINPSMLKDNPLLAAAIEADRGAPEPARQLLSRVEVDGLDEWRLALWARLMESTGRRVAPADANRQTVAAQPPAAAAPGIPPVVLQRKFRPPANQRPPRYTARKKAGPAQTAQQKQQPPPAGTQPLGGKQYPQFKATPRPITAPNGG